MNLSRMLGEKAIAKGCYLLVALFVGLVSARAQNYEITPMVGATFGGTMHLEQPGTPNFYAHMADSISFGLAGGYRLDGEGGEGYDVIEFRWLRRNSHLGLQSNPLFPTPHASVSFRPSVTLDHFLADFTHEFTVQDAPAILPFVRGSAGVALLSTPQSNATRFTFGIATGMKVFPSSHFGFRVEAEYLPIVMHTELQRLVCTGGCVVILNGGVMNQFQVSIGPAFRF
jgi:hypothetical protein